MPTQGAYVPPSHYIVKIPDLNEPNADDTSYRFGNTRVSPYFMHTALKSHQIKPNAKVEIPKNIFKAKKHMKYTRLSRGYTHHGLFSTIN